MSTNLPTRALRPLLVPLSCLLLNACTPLAAVLSGSQDLVTLKPVSATGLERTSPTPGSKDKTVTPLSVGGSAFPHGYVVRAPSELVFRLNGNCDRLNVRIGLDDQTRSQNALTFQVFADDQKRFDSGPVRSGQAARPVQVDVMGAQTMRLVVSGEADARADWLTPTLTCEPWGGPIVITQGGTYSGAWESTDPNTPAVIVRTSDPVTITRSRIRGVGHYGLIEGTGNRLTVTNTVFEGQRPRIRGRSAPMAVSLFQARRLTFEHNVVRQQGGVRLTQWQGQASDGDTVRIRYNLASNIDGRQDDGFGNPITSGERTITNFVQFNQVQGISGAEIAWNQVINTPYQSLVEDNINMYLSSGVKDSPIKIHDNYIQGAYNADPAHDARYAGGGILLGDGKSERLGDNGYQWAYNNRVVGTANYALGVLGGLENRLYDNRAIGSGLLPDGRPIASQNTGLVVWNMYKAGAGLFGNNSVKSNAVAWNSRVRSSQTSPSPWYIPDCDKQGNTCDNTNLGLASPEQEQAEFSQWQKALRDAGIQLGTTVTD
ncbi:NPCBM/NEW2 domain-containing protein [Deinococcus sonorensis]|uniref:NPCBM/NEW2 domain-containing protein n=2 Tax=Deinococcus sonorensis TaxID=309891 RepID=A0AAU7UAJ1_9DEIO